MKGAQMRRGLRTTLIVLVVGLVATAFSAAEGTSAHAAAAKACAKVGVQGRSGRYSGMISALPVGAPCVIYDDRYRKSVVADDHMISVSLLLSFWVYEIHAL